MQEILSNVKGTPIFGAGDFADQAKALVENIQRKNLAPLEEARAIQKLTEKISFSFSNPSVSPDSQLPTPNSQLVSLTQEAIAKGLGKSQPFVSECLAIATLTEEELAKLSPRDKLQKKKLLQLLKSRNRAAQNGDKRKEIQPIHYEFKRNRLKVRVDFDMEKGDRLFLISKLREVIQKLEEGPVASDAEESR